MTIDPVGAPVRRISAASRRAGGWHFQLMVPSDLQSFDGVKGNQEVAGHTRARAVDRSTRCLGQESLAPLLNNGSRISL